MTNSFINYLKSRGWETKEIKSPAYIGNTKRWRHPSMGGPWFSQSNAMWLQERIDKFLAWRYKRAEETLDG